MTSQFDNELKQLKLINDNEILSINDDELNTDQIIIDYIPTDIEQLQTRMWHMDQRLRQFDDYMKWNDLWTQRFRVILNLI